MKTIYSLPKQSGNLWVCPKCGRKFEQHFQSYSCKAFPLLQHFEGKPESKLLYKKFTEAVKKKIKHFTIESLECCIHFVSSFTFASVKVFKEHIEVGFSLNHLISSNKINNCAHLSANRYLYYVKIMDEEDIDEVLIKWIVEASTKREIDTSVA
jgi:Domain of unknown function (DUF5655)